MRWISSLRKILPNASLQAYNQALQTNFGDYFSCYTSLSFPMMLNSKEVNSSGSLHLHNSEFLMSGNYYLDNGHVYGLDGFLAGIVLKEMLVYLI